MTKLEKISISIEGADVMLSNPIDEFGEFMSLPFIEQLKDITSEMMTEFRNTD